MNSFQSGIMQEKVYRRGGDRPKMCRNGDLVLKYISILMWQVNLLSTDN